MPYHSLGDQFVGRVEAIWDLHDSLFLESTAVLQGTGVLAGTGGLGKTQLAIEYAPQVLPPRCDDGMHPAGRWLASHRQTMGRFTAARDLLRKALASAEGSFESGHPSIARSQSNLAMVLRDLGDLEEARDLRWKAYSASLERYGPDYPATKTYKRNLDSLPEK